jgi:hypothetical protein
MHFACVQLLITPLITDTLRVLLRSMPLTASGLVGTVGTQLSLYSIVTAETGANLSVSDREARLRGPQRELALPIGLSAQPPYNRRLQGALAVLRDSVAATTADDGS